MKFSTKDFFIKPNPQFPAGLVTFIEVILNGKLHFLRSEIKAECSKYSDDQTQET